MQKNGPPTAGAPVIAADDGHHVVGAFPKKALGSKTQSFDERREDAQDPLWFNKVLDSLPDRPRTGTVLGHEKGQSSQTLQQDSLAPVTAPAALPAPPSPMPASASEKGSLSPGQESGSVASGKNGVVKDAIFWKNIVCIWVRLFETLKSFLLACPPYPTQDAAIFPAKGQR